MPFKIQRQPLGLGNLLSIFGGQSPTELEDRARVIVDGTDFYGASQVVATSENQAAGASAGTFAGASSANARRYLGLSGAFIVGAAAGTYLTVSVGITFPNGTVVQWGNTNIPTPIATATYRVVANFPGPIVLPPGCSPSITVDSNAGGADHVKQLRYSFQRLDLT